MSARLSASVVETSGLGAPSRTTTPTPTRPSATCAALSSLPGLASSSSVAGGAITTSGVAPAPMSRRMSGVVANVIVTMVPVRWRKRSAAASNAGSTAAPLSTLISAAGGMISFIQMLSWLPELQLLDHALLFRDLTHRVRVVVLAVEIEALLIELDHRGDVRRLIQTPLEGVVQGLHDLRVHALRPADAVGRVRDDIDADLAQRRHRRPVLGPHRTP